MAAAVDVVTETQRVEGEAAPISNMANKDRNAAVARSSVEEGVDFRINVGLVGCF